VKRITNAQIIEVRKKVVAQQGGKCAICKIKFTKQQVPCLDHDHVTGAIRGALCRNCNRGEGKIKNVAVSCKRTASPFDWICEYTRYMIKHQKPQNAWIHPKHKSDDEKRLLRNKRARIAAAKKRLVKNGKR